MYNIYIYICFLDFLRLVTRSDSEIGKVLLASKIWLELHRVILGKSGKADTTMAQGCYDLFASSNWCIGSFLHVPL